MVKVPSSGSCAFVLPEAHVRSSLFVLVDLKRHPSPRLD
jgi:hypothetical protein